MEAVCNGDNQNVMQRDFDYKHIKYDANITNSPFLHKYSATKAATCT